MCIRDRIDTNIKGLVTITRLVLPQMVERNSGHIINLGSIAGTYPYAGYYTPASEPWRQK